MHSHLTTKLCNSMQEQSIIGHESLCHFTCMFPNGFGMMWFLVVIILSNILHSRWCLVRLSSLRLHLPLSVPQRYSHMFLGYSHAKEDNPHHLFHCLPSLYLHQHQILVHQTLATTSCISHAGLFLSPKATGSYANTIFAAFFNSMLTYNFRLFAYCFQKRHNLVSINIQIIKLFLSFFIPFLFKFTLKLSKTVNVAQRIYSTIIRGLYVT